MIMTHPLYGKGEKGGEVLKWTFDRVGKKVNCISAKAGLPMAESLKELFAYQKS
jgi:hypothetical protein